MAKGEESCCVHSIKMDERVEECGERGRLSRRRMDNGCMREVASSQGLCSKIT